MIVSVLGLMTMTVAFVTVSPMTVSMSHTAIKKGMAVAMTLKTAEEAFSNSFHAFIHVSGKNGQKVPRLMLKDIEQD